MKKQKRQLPVISTVVILILFVGESSPSTDVLQERLSIQSKYIRDVPTGFGWKVICENLKPERNYNFEKISSI